MKGYEVKLVDYGILTEMIEKIPSSNPWTKFHENSLEVKISLKNDYQSPNEDAEIIMREPGI